jgi:hypothetical protein
VASTLNKQLEIILFLNLEKGKRVNVGVHGVIIIRWILNASLGTSWNGLI